MDEASARPSSCIRLVACPDCGETFSRRGIAPHRRARHTGLQPRTHGPADATRAEPAPARIITLLEHGAAALERIEVRLVELELRLARDRPDDFAQLERSLTAVLREIAQVKAEAAERASATAERDRAVDPREIECGTIRHLGTLRRRQASILLRMQELSSGGDALADCLI